MKRAGFALFIAMVVLVAGTEASIVKVTYTGDNIVAAMYQNGGAPQTIAVGPNASNWKVADTVSLDLAWGHEYQLIFRVANTWASPAAFLAEISGDVVDSAANLTSLSWQYSPYTGPVSDFGTLTWSQVSAFGNNGEPGIVWTTSNSGNPVAGISQDAEWIWRAGGSGTIPENETLWLRTTINTTIPEPTTIIIWSLLGGLTLAMWRRR